MQMLNGVEGLASSVLQDYQLCFRKAGAIHELN